MYIIVLRLLIIFAVLLAIYIALAAYSRWSLRERLKSEHAAGAGGGLTSEDYVQKGLAVYERSWQRKALYAVFLLPGVTAVILVVIANIG
ncbi:MAG: hypothetical protein AAGI70_12725 [Pseudomonadota bacterium]